MATSAIDICNMALDYLHIENITSLEEDTRQAKKCAQWYDTIRKTLLINLNASFSIERATLVEKKDYTPIYGYEKAYSLPYECLQVLNVGDPKSDIFYQIEGDSFYCQENSTNIQIRYIKDVKDVNLFDANFIKLLALSLAVEICVPLTDDYQKRNALQALKDRQYQETSVKYGRDNKITVINKPKYRNARYFAEINDSNYPIL